MTTNGIQSPKQLLVMEKREAEECFNSLPKEERLRLLEESEYNPQLLELASDAGEIIPSLPNRPTLRIIFDTGWSESIFLECLTAEQFVNLLDILNYGNGDGDSAESCRHLLLALKDFPEEKDETVFEILKEVGVERIHSLFCRHITIGEDVEDARSPSQLSYQGRGYAEADLEDFCQKMDEVSHDLFCEFYDTIFGGEILDEEDEEDEDSHKNYIDSWVAPARLVSEAGI
ncbi:MAG: hypothetical protein HY602_01690 [Parcubacteria group bacterium]|nr:hypothetical protein [Parcubacteria group bacterium]